MRPHLFRLVVPCTVRGSWCLKGFYSGQMTPSPSLPVPTRHKKGTESQCCHGGRGDRREQTPRGHQLESAPTPQASFEPAAQGTRTPEKLQLVTAFEMVGKVSSLMPSSLAFLEQNVPRTRHHTASVWQQGGPAGRGGSEPCMLAQMQDPGPCTQHLP